MSSRVLRKLQGETDLASELGALDGSDPENNEEDLLASASIGGTKKKQLNVNRYDLLNQQSLSESEVKEDDNETEHAQDQDGEGPAGDGVKHSTRRKKKKKKKKSLKPSSNQRSSEDMEGDEIDQVNRLLGHPATSSEPTKDSSSAQEAVRTKALLSIEHRNLNPNNELKRIFGIKIVQSEQRKRTRGTRSCMRVAGLATPKETWPHVGKQGITMRYVEQRGPVQIFAYEHNAAYQQVQRMFLAAVESLNPDNVVAIINAHPYHVDALLQLADLCRMSEDLQMAADLVERAVYALECAFHPLFSLAQGNCRLDYRRQENRALFVALFKHLSAVGQRACHRTALELCKVLLSLDPEGDPLAMVLVVDLYALRSRQYSWLLRVTQEWEATRNLSQLPNFAFSKAVAHFQLAQTGSQTADLSEADAALQQALIMFPGVLTRLLDKCSVQPDSKVIGHHFFGAKAQTSMTPALAQLVQLYVTRAWPVWKEGGLLAWLERNTHAVLARVDAKDPLVAECEGYRRRRYQGTPPRNITRHILLADLKDVPPAIAQDEAQGPVLSFDPLPPMDSINLYDRPQRPRGATSVGSPGALSMFFRSLLPTFNIHDQEALFQEVEEEAGDGLEEEGAAGGPDVRRSLASLMDVLRDLLSNIQLPDAPDRGDADVDSSGDDDDDDDPAYDVT